MITENRNTAKETYVGILIFEGTPLNMLTDFTSNDLSCRAIDLKKLPLCIQILNIFKKSLREPLIGLRPMPSLTLIITPLCRWRD